MLLFVPALRFHFLTKFFDLSIRLFFPEKKLRNAILNSITNQPQSILDYGCGTGTLCMALKEKFTHAQVTGLDADAKILALAKKKIKALPITLAQGVDLSNLTGGWDVITSTLVFHHLTTIEKENLVQQIAEKLNPNGLFIILDFDVRPQWNAQVAFFFVRCLDGFSRTKIHAQAQLKSLIMRNSTLLLAQEQTFKTTAGTLKLYSFKKL